MTRLPRTGKPIPNAKPRWDTLLSAVREPHPRDFVWTGAVRLTDGTRVDGFVHAWTGRGLLLGDDGAAFGLTPTGRYKQQDLQGDVEFALPHRWQWLDMGGYTSRDVGPEPYPEDEATGEDEWFVPSTWTNRG